METALEPISLVSVGDGGSGRACVVCVSVGGMDEMVP